MRKVFMVGGVVGVFVLFGILGCAPRRMVKPVTEQPEVTPEEVAEPAVRSKDFEKDVNLDNVYFDFDRSNIREDDKPTLEENAQYLKENPNLDILVEGHCDERGSVAYNLALGQRRATAVRNHYIKLGLGGGRIATISYGEERPLDSGHNEDAWAKNRRAETKVKSK